MAEYSLSDRFKNLERSTDWLSDQELKDSILEHGCVCPVVAWTEGGVLIDGHRRHAICEELGISPVVVWKSFDSEDSAAEWAKSQQGHRRNLTPEEIKQRRADGVRRLVSTTPPEAGIHVDTLTGGVDQPVGTKKAAKKLGAAQSSVKRDRDKIKLAESLPEDLKPVAESMTVKQVNEALKLGGRELEQHVRKIANPQPEDEYAAKFDAVLSLLSAAHRALKAIDEIDEMQEFYTNGVATRVKLHISDAKGVLNQIRPEKHDRCGGIGCDLCSHRGWTTKANNERKL